MPSYLTLGLWWEFGMGRRKRKNTHERESFSRNAALVSGDALCCVLKERCSTNTTALHTSKKNKQSSISFICNWPDGEKWAVRARIDFQKILLCVDTSSAFLISSHCRIKLCVWSARGDVLNDARCVASDLTQPFQIIEHRQRGKSPAASDTRLKH